MTEAAPGASVIVAEPQLVPADPPQAFMAVIETWPGRKALYFPASSDRATALAVELHGSGLDPLRQYRMSRLADLLIPNGVAVLLPRAGTPFHLMPDLADGFAWNIPGVPLPGVTGRDHATADDLGYVTSLVEVFQTKLRLRDAPLFLIGYSGGARFASHLLTSGQLRWTAAGLVAGLRPPGHGGRPPPPTISFHGVGDRINPYFGGAGPRWDTGVDEAARLYASAQRASLWREVPAHGASRRVYRSADGEHSLSTYAVSGAAHAWPGTRDEGHLAVFGPAGDGTDASALIAEFFRSMNGKGE